MTKQIKRELKKVDRILLRAKKKVLRALKADRKYRKDADDFVASRNLNHLRLDIDSLISDGWTKTYYKH